MYKTLREITDNENNLEHNVEYMATLEKQKNGYALQYVKEQTEENI